MSEILDMEDIYRQERQRWLREEAPRRSFREMHPALTQPRDGDSINGSYRTHLSSQERTTSIT